MIEQVCQECGYVWNPDELVREYNENTVVSLTDAESEFRATTVADVLFCPRCEQDFYPPDNPVAVEVRAAIRLGVVYGSGPDSAANTSPPEDTSQPIEDL